MKTFLKASIGFAIILVAPAALAQAPGNNPNAQQIINALKPTGTLSTTTRGIVPLAQGTQQAAPSMPLTQTASHPGVMMAHHAVNAPAPSPVSGQGSVNLNIDFASGSAALTPRAKAELDQLGHALTSQQLAAFKFNIVGHTDTTGTPAANLALSNARAHAVATYIETKFHVASSKLEASGVGEKDLLVKTPPQTPNLQNRRVQIINIGK
jgi:outer membrane protein OmpA-like peptidoglycan-associated protein